MCPPWFVCWPNEGWCSLWFGLWQNLCLGPGAMKSDPLRRRGERKEQLRLQAGGIVAHVKWLCRYGDSSRGNSPPVTATAALAAGRPPRRCQAAGLLGRASGPGTLLAAGGALVPGVLPLRWGAPSGDRPAYLKFVLATHVMIPARRNDCGTRSAPSWGGRRTPRGKLACAGYYVGYYRPERGGANLLAGARAR